MPGAVGFDDGGVFELADEALLKGVDIFAPQYGLLGLFRFGKPHRFLLGGEFIDSLNFCFCHGYISFLPSRARAKVNSSAYSKSPPTGIP